MADWQSLGDRAEKLADKSASAYPVLLLAPISQLNGQHPATNLNKSVLQEVGGEVPRGVVNMCVCVLGAMDSHKVWFFY